MDGVGAMPGVRNRFRRTVARGLTVALLTSGVAAFSAGPAVAGTAASFATLNASGADPIVNDGAKVFFAGRDTYNVTGTAETGVQLEAIDPFSRSVYKLRFAAPAGEALAVGAYEQAQVTPDASHPGIAITRGSTSCASTGRFDVLDMAPDASHFWIVYQHLCEGQSAPAFGEIRHNLPSGPGLTVFAGRIAWPTATFDQPGRGVSIRVTNYEYDAATITGTTISGPGAANFSASSGACGKLSFNTSCSVGVTYRPVTVGPGDATLTITDSIGGSTVVSLVGSGLQADDPGIVRAVGVPPGKASGTAQVDYDKVILTLYHPSDFDWSDTVVRMAAGTTPPATLADGVQVYAGRAQTVEVPDLEEGTPYSFSFFSRDAEGLVAEPGTTSVRATAVSIKADRTRITYGEGVVLSGVVRDLQTGVPLEFTDIIVVAYDVKFGDLVPVARSRAYAGGEYEYGVTPNRSYVFYVVGVGDSGHLAGSSGPIEVKVSASVHIGSPFKGGDVGVVLPILGGADPLDPTIPLTLQEKINGKWKTIAKKKPNKKGVATFKVPLKIKGKHIYRIYRPGSLGVGGGYSKSLTIRVR